MKSDHGSVFALTFKLDGEVYACIASEDGHDSNHVEIDTTNDLERVCDAVYFGRGMTLIF